MSNRYELPSLAAGARFDTMTRAKSLVNVIDEWPTFSASRTAYHSGQGSPGACSAYAMSSRTSVVACWARLRPVHLLQDLVLS
jgi:hypothetical protein